MDPEQDNIPQKSLSKEINVDQRDIEHVPNGSVGVIPVKWDYAGGVF